MDYNGRLMMNNTYRKSWAGAMQSILLAYLMSRRVILYESIDNRKLDEITYFQ